MTTAYLSIGNGEAGLKTRKTQSMTQLPVYHQLKDVAQGGSHFCCLYNLAQSEDANIHGALANARNHKYKKQTLHCHQFCVPPSQGRDSFTVSSSKINKLRPL